jgi:DNA-binding transcriptional regulator YiaG
MNAITVPPPEEIRRLRVESYFPVSHIAETLGVTPAQWMAWERGDQPMPPEKFERFGQMLVVISGNAG